MNRVVKAFLAIAVAIIFPCFVYLAVVTFIPERSQSELRAPSYPKSPTCYRGNNQNNYYGSNTTTKECQQDWDDYDREKLDYDESMNSYNSQLRDMQSVTNGRTQKRAELAIVFGILGLILIYFVRDITALVIGFSVSSTSILVVAVGNLNDLGEGVKNPLASALSILSFIAIIVMIWLIDTMLYPSPKKLIAPNLPAPTLPPEKTETS